MGILVEFCNTLWMCVRTFAKYCKCSKKWVGRGKAKVVANSALAQIMSETNRKNGVATGPNSPGNTKPRTTRDVEAKMNLVMDRQSIYGDRIAKQETFGYDKSPMAVRNEFKKIDTHGFGN